MEQGIKEHKEPSAMAGKYQAYPEYKDSGVEWLESVPAHWEVKRVKHLAQLNPPKGEVRGHSEDEHVSFIPMEAIGEQGELDTSRSRPLGEVLSGYTYVADGDVMLAKITPCFENGKAAVARGLLQGIGFATTEVIPVRPNDPEDAKFFYYLLTSMPFKAVAEGSMYGAGGQKRVADSFVAEYHLATPPSLERTQIAAFLDHETARIDRLIEKQQQLIELLKEKRQAVISHAVTKGLDPNVPMKDSGVEWLGQVPEHWALPKLIHVTTRVGDGLHSTPVYGDGTGYYFVNGNNLSAGIIKLGPSSKEVPESEYHKHHIPLDHSTLLMSINGTIGNLALYRSEPVILGKSACYINCGYELDRRFLLGFLRSNEIERYFDTEVTGTTIYNLSLNSVRQMRVCLPSRSEQDEIVRYCEQKDHKFERLIGHASKAVELLQERRTALISAAVTGKIDLRGWEKPAEVQTAEPELPMVAESESEYRV